MKKRTVKRLSLNRENIRDLTPKEAANINGGDPWSGYEICTVSNHTCGNA